MKKIFAALLALSMNACALSEPETVIWEQPDYNHIAAHARVVAKSPNFVTYEYKDIRVDEIAPVAALYCQDRGGKQASLYEIVTRPDNSRRATFVCQKLADF